MPDGAIVCGTLGAASVTAMPARRRMSGQAGGSGRIGVGGIDPPRHGWLEKTFGPVGNDRMVRRDRNRQRDHACATGSTCRWCHGVAFIRAAIAMATGRHFGRRRDGSLAVQSSGLGIVDNKPAGQRQRQHDRHGTTKFHRRHAIKITAIRRGFQRLHRASWPTARIAALVRSSSRLSTVTRHGTAAAASGRAGANIADPKEPPPRLLPHSAACCAAGSQRVARPSSAA